MTTLTIRGSGPLRGAITVPGDKSISHRALLLGAIAHGRSRVTNFLDGADCRATLGAIRALGAEVETVTPNELVVTGRGVHGLKEPDVVLDCGGSGTTMRLLAGLLAGQPFLSILVGNPQLSRRPMGRVAEPLRLMGATVLARSGGKLPPLVVQGGDLHGIEYSMPVASAQVKSCILLAGLYAQGATTVHEPEPTRDHTERMLLALGATVISVGKTVRVEPVQDLSPFDIAVPADISSAAFPIVAALLVPDSAIVAQRVGVNPTRTGLLDVLERMGAHIALEQQADAGSEPVAHVHASASALKATTVGGAEVPRMIDEFPILAVAATQAAGVTVVHDAAELRVKESDRISTLAGELRKMGARIEEFSDGFAVEGPTPLVGALVDSHRDHRLAMSLAVAGLIARGETKIGDAECIADSYPGFAEGMRALGATLDG